MDMSDFLESEFFRYIVPGYLFLFYILVLFPEQIKITLMNDWLTIISLGLLGLILGFVIGRLIYYPLVYEKLVSKKWFPRRIRVLDAMIENELRDVSNVWLNKYLRTQMEPSAIQDAVLNQQLSDRVLQRFFFLNDLFHSFNVCLLATIIAVVLAISKLIYMSSVTLFLPNEILSIFLHDKFGLRNTLVLTLIGPLFALSLANSSKKLFNKIDDFGSLHVDQNLEIFSDYIKKVKAAKLIELVEQRINKLEKPDRLIRQKLYALLKSKKYDAVTHLAQEILVKLEDSNSSPCNS